MRQFRCGSLLPLSSVRRCRSRNTAASSTTMDAPAHTPNMISRNLLRPALSSTTRSSGVVRPNAATVAAYGNAKVIHQQNYLLGACSGVALFERTSRLLSQPRAVWSWHRRFYGRSLPPKRPLWGVLLGSPAALLQVYGDSKCRFGHVAVSRKRCERQLRFEDGATIDGFL